jgi:threonine dehydratase
LSLDVHKAGLEAERRIREHIRETPAEPSAYLSQIGHSNVHLKLENWQITGSFKLRGAVNKFLSLGYDEKKQGLVTASSGNHGNAFAHVLRRFGAKGTIYLPENASPAKVEALASYGVDLELYGDDCVRAELFAKKMAEERNQVYVSPYNDPEIVGGQATVGVELARQLDDIDVVFVPVGGGGLISGVAGFLKSVHPGVKIIGCQPENSRVMFESIRAGELLDLGSLPSLSDGTAGGIEAGSITFDICRTFVDDFVLVSEEEIASALKLLLEKHHMLVEGSAALSVAAFLKNIERFEGKSVVLVLSGCKISLDSLRQVLTSQ